MTLNRHPAVSDEQHCTPSVLHSHVSMPEISCVYGANLAISRIAEAPSLKAPSQILFRTRRFFLHWAASLAASPSSSIDIAIEPHWSPPARGPEAGLQSAAWPACVRAQRPAVVNSTGGLVSSGSSVNLCLHRRGRRYCLKAACPGRCS